VERSAVVRCPLCQAEYELNEALALAPPELIVVAGGVAAEEPSAAVEAALGETIAEEGGPEGVNEAAAMAQRLPAMPAAARFRSRRHKSVLQTAVEIVLGGVAGIVVAYYGLALFYRADFHRLGLPQLPLPFIQWITAPPAHHGNGGHEGEKPPADEPVRPKPVSSTKGRSTGFQPVPMPLPAQARCPCYRAAGLASAGETPYSSSIHLSQGYAVVGCHW